nr:PLD nuclease N-terminal domain-containing protein [Nesterenkonia lacusekhoensis]
MRILIPVGIVGLGLMIYSLVESIQTPRHRVRVMPKSAWMAVIVLVPIIGAGLWLGFGRIRETRTRDNQVRPGPSAPDDDPEFLRKVEFERRQQQRREEEARKRAEQERKKRAQNRKQQDQQDRKKPGEDSDEKPGDDVEGGLGPEGRPA